ncbi:arsenite methyltransferase isoform X3 [Rhea pennata]|uniref:arsenite methyltransferase isoform X3 n=1 Tax=Rhea pennata TaxID=8795 RepID=UPI002E275CB2
MTAGFPVACLGWARPAAGQAAPGSGWGPGWGRSWCRKPGLGRAPGAGRRGGAWPGPSRVRPIRDPSQPQAVELAKKHIAYHMDKFGYQKPNVDFILGYVEKLGDAGLADESYDIVVSNCVINLCPDKGAVLREAYRVLKPGGEMYFSDVYASRRLSEAARAHGALWGECLAGALRWSELRSIARDVGFSPPRLVAASPIAVGHRELESVAGGCQFVSATVRLFKVPAGSRAGPGRVVYNGGVAGHERELVFDAGFTFKEGEAVEVDADTAAILRSSRFAEEFLIQDGGDAAAPPGCCRGRAKERICDPFQLVERLGAPGPGCCPAGACGPRGCC